MTTKVFAEKGRVKLVGDPRGFTVSSQQRINFYNWCYENSIVTEYHGTLNGVDLWYIKNVKDRMFAMLRWA